MSEEAKDLVQKLLIEDPEQRITAADALQHAWFTQPANAQGGGIGIDTRQIDKFNRERRKQI